MSEAKLRNALRPLVLQYGFGMVEQCLQKMEPSDHRRSNSRHLKGRETSFGNDTVPKSRKKSGRVTAPEYASKMDVSSEKNPMLTELARKFEDKSFLPTFGDIRNFCQIYGIAEPASKSRTSAIPRIFKFIAAMDTGDVRKILEGGMFSGPSRLGPIADAIRNSAKNRDMTRSLATQSPTTSSLPSDIDAENLRSRP